MNIKAWLLFVAALTLHGAHPEAFSSLGSAVEREAVFWQNRRDEAAFAPYVQTALAYDAAVESAFDLGFELDRRWKRGESDDGLKRRYLDALRALEPHRETLRSAAQKVIADAMASGDAVLVERLVRDDAGYFGSDRLKKRLHRFYASDKRLRQSERYRAMQAEAELDRHSREVAREEELAYAQHLKVLSAKKSRQLSQSRSVRHSVMIASVKTPNGFEFVAKNRNPFTVSLTLDFDRIDNLQSSKTLPYRFELPGKTERNVLELHPKVVGKAFSFESEYHWAMGSASANHDDSVLYRIPFERGRRVSVSQGYNGGVTHKGLSRYAVDFPVPIGTPIYAARGGRVVAAVERNRKGKFEKAYRAHANYIIIEHDDRTFGKYWHLKENGVKVRIGEQVEAGDLIGYSGNTGYTSGPHLHFSVSKLDPQSRNKSLTVPVRFAHASGVANSPRRGDIYVVK